MTTKVPSSQIVKIDALRLSLSLAGNDGGDASVTVTRAQKFYDFIVSGALVPLEEVKVPAKRGRKPKVK